MPETMLDPRSPVATQSAFAAAGIAIREEGGFALTQVAGFGKGWEKPLAAAVGKLPARIGVAQQNDVFTVLRISPQQVWCIGAQSPEGLPPECLVTHLSSGRCRIRVEGARARQVLARAAQVDFDARSFKPGQFAMTGIHHTPVLIHCVEADAFHVYAMRSFAQAVWEWLSDAAAGLVEQA